MVVKTKVYKGSGMEPCMVLIVTSQQIECYLGEVGNGVGNGP